MILLRNSDCFSFFRDFIERSMTSMSTPINQLPANGAHPPVSGGEEDPFVAGVIQEMENEFKKASPPVTASPSPVPTHYIPTPIITQVVAPKPAPSWYHEESAKRAAIVAVIAFILMYPSDLTHLYAKVPVLLKFATYDHWVRMLMLAVVLYVLFWKLKI
jgi:hypothetical protein